MKKHILFLFALVMVFSLVTGCGKKNNPMDTSRPTMPAETAVTKPTGVTVDPARPTETSFTEETIEDGNGPIASQQADR